MNKSRIGGKCCTWMALLLLTATAGLILSGCRKKANLDLRTDSAPLTKRLNLPPLHGAVRWVAYSPNNQSTLVPGPTDFFTLYAYIELDDAGWAALEKSAGTQDAVDTLTVPKDVAAVLIPSLATGTFQVTGEGSQAKGPSLRGESLVADPKTQVEKAVRVGTALIIQMEVS